MTAFTRLREEFETNWATIYVGWKGLSEFAPWHLSMTEFPPLLSLEEVQSFAIERLGSCSDAAERDLAVSLLALDRADATREDVAELLRRLALLSAWESSRELRKWRIVLLEDLLQQLPSHPVYGLVALSEFWQAFGFPRDGPHEIQGRGNSASPEEYYTADNFRRLIARHKAWLECEKALLKERSGPEH